MPRETEINESMSARTWISPVPGRGTAFPSSKPENYRHREGFYGHALGEKTFNEKIRAACVIAGLQGEGFVNIITANSLRATMIQWLLDANHPETVIAKKTGHKDMKSLKSYNNLRGDQSKAQQTNMFGAFNEKKRSFPIDSKPIAGPVVSAREAKRPKTDEDVPPSANHLASILSRIQSSGTSSINLSYYDGKK